MFGDFNAGEKTKKFIQLSGQSKMPSNLISTKTYMVNKLRSKNYKKLSNSICDQVFLAGSNFQIKLMYFVKFSHLGRH